MILHPSFPSQKSNYKQLISTYLKVQIKDNNGCNF